MSGVFVILSHTGYVSQFSLSTLITPLCREAHEAISYDQKHIEKHTTTEPLFSVLECHFERGP